MENFERAKEEERGKVDNPSRRNFLRSIGAIGAAIACGGVQETFGQDASAASRYGEKWFFPLEQMKVEYEREYNGEKLLKNRFKKVGGRIIGLMNGKEIDVPHEFVDRVLEHLKKMIETGAARFIFRLDAFHGHPYLQTDLYKRRYGELKDEIKETRALVADPDVEILYHNFEHLDPADDSVRSLVQKRNVTGRIADGSVEILPLPGGGGKRTAQDTPEGTTNFNAYVRFAANKNGEFAILFEGQEVRLDLSLDDNSYF